MTNGEKIYKVTALSISCSLLKLLYLIDCFHAFDLIVYTSYLFVFVLVLLLFQNGKPAECKQDIWKWNCPNERSTNPTEQWWRLLRSVVKQIKVLSKLYETSSLTMCCRNQWLSKTITLETLILTLCSNNIWC